MKEVDFKLLSLELIRYALIILLLYTAYHKLIDLEAFEENVLRSKIIFEYSKILKYALPIIEILIAVILFLDKSLIYGLYSSLFLMVCFTFYLIALNNFSLFYGCSCGGIFNTMSYLQHVIVNFVIIIMNTIAIFLYDKKYDK